ncbi:16109_t:CDS:2 [Acaulospora morrowiae]|uniref:16109_t:CDS:1 n=1 Tax=Acaulospora morrowiae TaxID=94023 RepID=A0A9N9E8V1_9GLOM|nr:16109_t:CDS:2 [Acaulospora morrowiae]
MIQQPVQDLSSLNRKGSMPSRSCKADGHGVSATVCANCSTTTTPLWRRAPNGETICNACGLYLKARNTVRPPWLKRNAIKKATPAISEAPVNNSGGTCPGDGHCDGTGGSSSCDGCPAYNQHQVNRQALVCANCGTNTTPLWRRDEAGNTICNACGLYFKLHNVHRPVTMKRSVIKRRKRVALATSPPPQVHHSNGSDNERSHKRPPTPASTSGSERGYFSSDDDICSIEDLSSVSRKRKADDSTVSNGKRRCGNNGRASAIEDHHYTSRRNERRRSLSPVEPSLNSGMPQVHIHQNNSSYDGHILGTPNVPLPSVFSGQYGNDGSAPSQTQNSSSISALLNPSPANNVGPQLAPINSGQPATTEVTGSQGMSMGLPVPMNAHHHSSQPIQGVIPPMANSVPDPNLTHQVLQAHRQELQREVSHLSMLLNRTTAILVGLDQAMASNAVNRSGIDSCMTYRSSTDNGSLLGNSRSTYNVGLPTPPVVSVGQNSYILPPLSPSSSSDSQVSR